MAASPEFDTSVAHPARVYDYWLGGTGNFPADRELGDAMIRAIPALPAMARANRSFMERATRHLVESGVTQFLDIGSGIPTSPNLHEIAQGIDPSVRVVYVDNDPLVAEQSRAMLAGVPGVAYLHGDAPRPGRGADRGLAPRHAPRRPARGVLLRRDRAQGLLGTSGAPPEGAAATPSRRASPGAFRTS